MKHLSLIAFGILFSLPTLASTRLHVKPRSVILAAQCAADQSPVWVVLKESFRLYPERHNGTHQYFLLVGCESANQANHSSSTSTRVSGTVYTGSEADADYSLTTPHPLPSTESIIPFTGFYASSTVITHGSSVQIQSDSGNISVTGNFYSNRDITYTINSKVVPATLLPIQE
jgi:hypothetical protein